VANKLDILGVANSATNVQVWKDSDSPSNANRSGEYFHLALSVANGSYPQVYAKSLSGTNQQATAGRSFVPPSTEEYHYDADGNLVDDGRWISHVWDGENRLIEMSRDTNALVAARQKVTFAYDHLGRRTRKTYFTHNSTNWVEERDTSYLHDGWNLVAELDANSSNATLRTYVWGTDMSGSRGGAGGVGGLLWLNNQQTSTNGMPTGIQFVAYDGNGNVAGLFAAADGSNTARYEYGPFGESLRATGALAGANPIRWSSKVTDDETGLVYYGFRYYSSSTGRWMSRDPIGELVGLNVYASLGNSPNDLVDIDGRVPHLVAKCAFGLGSLIGTAIGTAIWTHYYEKQPCYAGCNIGVDYDKPSHTITVRKCEIVIFYGHGNPKKPINWNVHECSRAGAVTCFPGQMNGGIPENNRIPAAPMGEAKQCLWNFGSRTSGAMYDSLDGNIDGVSKQGNNEFNTPFNGDRVLGAVIKSAEASARAMCRDCSCGSVVIRFFRNAKDSDTQVGPPIDAIFIKCRKTN
jgi:RHS repeat-associated protein